MRCPSCGTENREGTNFCERCGAPLPKVPTPAAAGPSFCPTCGAAVAAGVTFCPQCGASIGGGAAAPSPAAYQQSYAVQPQAAVPSYGAMASTPLRTDYSFGKWFLLSLLTFGIYGIWYEAQMFKDIETMSDDPSFRVPSAGLYIALSLLTFGAYECYWYYKAAEELRRIGPRYDRQVSISGSSCVLLALILVGTYQLIETTNSVAEAFNAAHRGAAVYQPGYAR